MKSGDLDRSFSKFYSSLIYFQVKKKKKKKKKSNGRMNENGCWTESGYEGICTSNRI